MNPYPKISNEQAANGLRALRALGVKYQSTHELHKACGGAGLSDQGIAVKRSRIAVWGRRLKKDMLALGLQEITKKRRVKDTSGKWTSSSIWKLN
jgi:hypothetical protein